MQSNDVEGLRRDFVLINTTTCYTGCCNIKLAAERQAVTRSGNKSPQAGLCSVGLKDPVSSIRSAPHNPYITITKSLRSTSIHVGHEFTHIQDSESSAPPRGCITSGRVLQQEHLVLMYARDREL